VKVEYAFETARVRLYLPQWGETWFYLDRHTTIAQFKKQCLEEDSFVKTVDFQKASSDGNHQAINDDETPLYNILTSQDKDQLFLKINDNVHLFPTVGSSEHEHAPSTTTSDALNDKWYKTCIQNGLSITHATTLSAFIH